VSPQKPRTFDDAMQFGAGPSHVAPRSAVQRENGKKKRPYLKTPSRLAANMAKTGTDARTCIGSCTGNRRSCYCSIKHTHHHDHHPSSLIIILNTLPVANVADEGLQLDVPLLCLPQGHLQVSHPPRKLLRPRLPRRRR